MELWRLIAHRHWISIRLPGGELRVCARCTGYLTGLITASYMIERTFSTQFMSLGIRVQSLICLLFMTPLVIDWVGQKWGIRESNNSLRLVTGFLMGFSIFISQYLWVNQEYRVISIGLVAILILIIGYSEEIQFHVSDTD
jgi:uncharacterized membrane protein